MEFLDQAMGWDVTGYFLDIKMNIDGFWYHKNYGFFPYSKNILEKKPHENSLFVSLEYHTELFSKAGSGYNLVFPEDETQFPYVEEVTINDEEVKKNIRKEAIDERNGLLKTSDWSQLPDVPEKVKEKYAPYRQALRDLTEQEGFPFYIEWPVHPDKEED